MGFIHTGICHNRIVRRQHFQGFFPKYDAGVYEEGNTTMVVSRGIGNSIISIRINNRPEVVVIVLE